MEPYSRQIIKPYSRQVYFYETDLMAIVHNANYLRIFEEARMNFMEQLGIPYPDMEGAGIHIPVVDAYARFHQPLKYGDTFCVDVQMTDFTGIRLTFHYTITRKSDGALITTGHSSHCFVDELTRLPINIRKKMPEEYLVMKANISE